MKKLVIVDTNILLNDPLSMFKFGESDLVIPLTVIDELDKFKKDLSVIGRNARKVSHLISILSDLGDFTEGIDLALAKSSSAKSNELKFLSGDDYDQLGKLYIFTTNISLPPGLSPNPDHHIIALGRYLVNNLNDYQEINLITNDINLQIKAKAFGVKAKPYKYKKTFDVDDKFKKITSIFLSTEQIKKLKSGGCIDVDELDNDNDNLYPNEYLVVKDSSTKHKPDPCLLAVYKNNQINPINDYCEDIYGISPRNTEQFFALNALLDDNIKLVTLSGIAGTGKTLLAMAAGLYKTLDDECYHKLLVSRPIFPIGRDLGFLPGDIDQKLHPWMQPIFDSLEFLSGLGKNSQASENFHQLFDQRIVAVEPLTYIRGRSLANHYFVVDEAQNLTPHEVKSILTRVGHGTKIVLTGDPNQIDLPYIDSVTNGLVYATEKFKDHSVAAHVSLHKGERSELAKLAAEIL